MESLTAFIVAVGTALASLITLVMLISKLWKAVKAKDYAKARNILQEATIEGMKLAEQFSGLGTTSKMKETIALNFVQSRMLANDCDYEETTAKDEIQKLIDFSKEVNSEKSGTKTLKQKEKVVEEVLRSEQGVNKNLVSEVKPIEAPKNPPDIDT